MAISVNTKVKTTKSLEKNKNGKWIEIKKGAIGTVVKGYRTVPHCDYIVRFTKHGNVEVNKEEITVKK